MAVTSFSSLLGFALPTTGDLTGTWGDTVNTGITALVDSAVAGTATASVTSADWTLTTTQGATNEARAAILRPTGSPGVSRNIIAPSQSKAYVVVNQSNAAVVVKGAATTGVSIVAGATALVAWDGSDFVDITAIASGLRSATTTVNVSSSAAPTVGQVLTATAGTTATWQTPSTLTAANSLNSATTTVNVSSSAAPTTGQVLIATSGTAATWQTSTDLPLAGGVMTGAITFAAGQFGTNVNTFLSTPTSANLAAALTDETGSGSNVFATSPTLVTPVLGTPSSGTLSSCTVDGTDAVGFRNIPVNSQSAAYTAVLTDSGKCIFHPSTDANARTFTIPANGSVAYAVGTAITFINMTAAVVTIAITTDTMYLSSAGTTGSRSLARYGSATAIKIDSTDWLISGSGLT